MNSGIGAAGNEPHGPALCFVPILEYVRYLRVQVANNRLTGTFPNSFALTNTSFINLLQL